MVLHVAGTERQVEQRTVVEFRKNHVERLLHHVGKYVQSPAMTHAEHVFHNAMTRRALDDVIEKRDHHFPTFE